MTIPEWLDQTELTPSEIARHCGVHRSQPLMWKRGNVPHGFALLRLIELSKKKITLADIPTKKPGGNRRRPKKKARTRRVCS